MKRRLHDHLDGDAVGEPLTTEELRLAREWEELIAASKQEPSVPPRIERDVMAAVRAGARSRLPFRPWTRRARFVAGALAAAVLAAVWLRVSGSSSAPSPAADAAATVAVDFSLEAPSARTVVVTGSFNHWGPGESLSDTNGDGTWTARVRLPQGVHQYMFVVDDNEWVADPRAERLVDDGFGRTNAVVAVLPSAPTM